MVAAKGKSDNPELDEEKKRRSESDSSSDSEEDAFALDDEAVDLRKDESDAAEKAKKELDESVDEEAGESSEEAEQPAPVEKGAEKPAPELPKVKVVLSAEEQRVATLQNFLTDKVNAGLLALPGGDTQAKDLLKRVQEELKGEKEPNVGHPKFGPATQELFAAYKKNLETEGVRKTLQQLAAMDLGNPVRSPELLQVTDHAGKMLPEQPKTFVDRMRRGDVDYKLSTLEGKKMVEVDTTKPPSQDVLDRMKSAEAFIGWANDEIIFDRKVRLQEHLLEERIKSEKYPKEWLEHPSKKENRYGWCMSVMQRIEESTNVGRTVEAIYDLRTRSGLGTFGDEALKALPPHIKVELEKQEGKDTVKGIAFGHPLNLDLQNSDFKAKRQAEVDWLKTYGPEVEKLLHKHIIATSEAKNYLFQGDINVHGMKCVVDKKTNEVLGMFKRDDIKTDEQFAAAFPGKDRKNYDVKDADLIRCRMNIGQERGENKELKFITVDYQAQYGKTPPLNYHNLFMTEVGNPTKPVLPGEADNLQRFKPKEWVLARSTSGELVPMQAKGLEQYKQFEDFKRIGEVAVSAVMDASLVCGVGVAVQGVRVVQGANAAMRALQAGQAGMQVARGIGTAEAAAGVGYRMIYRGTKDFALGASAVINNEDFQKARGFYFLLHAGTEIPGIKAVAGSARSRLPGAKDMEFLTAAKNAMVQDGKTLKEIRALGITEGAYHAVVAKGAEQGFKWSNRAFAGIISKELIGVGTTIANIGKLDGLDAAAFKMKGIRTDEKKLTVAEKREREVALGDSVAKVLEDYKKNSSGADGQEAAQILDRAKKLFEATPKELFGPPVKEAELKAFKEKRAEQIEQFKKEMRENHLQFSPERIKQAEEKRAKAFPVDSAADFARLKDDPVLVEGTKLEREKWETAARVQKEKEEEFKNAGEAKTDEDKAKRAEELRKLELHTAFAKERYDAVAAQQVQAIRTMELKDEKLGDPPSQKFADREQTQKAAALAYLLLSMDENGRVDPTKVLHQDTVTIPKWDVKKSWVVSSERSSHTVEQTLEVKAREVTQQLTVADLTTMLGKDLTSDKDALRRITTAEALDRMGAIPPEAHASVLKTIIENKNATPEERSRAVANLGAVILQIESEEIARVRSGMTGPQQLADASLRFGNTSKELRDVLQKVASDNTDNQDVRAIAGYMGFALDRKSGFWDDSDQDFFNKTILKEPPGIKYGDYLNYMKPLAGLAHAGKPPRELEVYDKADWDRRLRAATALSSLCDPARGMSADRQVTNRELNASIASCVDVSRPVTSAAAIESLLKTVNHDGKPRTLLQQLDKDDPAVAMQVREKALALLQTPTPPGSAGTEKITENLRMKAAILETLPGLMATSENFADQAKMNNLRSESAKILLGALSPADESEIRTIRAELRDAESKGDAKLIAAITKQLAVAEADFSLVTGKRVNADSPEVVDLSKKLRDAKSDSEREDLNAKLKAAYVKNNLFGESIRDTNGKEAPDLISLNQLAYLDSEVRKTAVKALAEMGVRNPSVTRMLIERASMPMPGTPSISRQEADPEVRMASIQALKTLMAPSEFSNLANQLVLRERSPGIATTLRLNTWYSDLGIDPQSPQYQDIATLETEWMTIPHTSVLRAKEWIVAPEGQPDKLPKYHWASGSTVAEEMAKKVDNEYWDVSPSYLFSSADTVRRNEQAALDKTYNTYRERLRTEVFSKVNDLSLTPEKRKEAREVAFAFLAHQIDGFEKPDLQLSAQKEVAYSNARLALDGRILQDIRKEAAAALVAGCKPGNPERAENSRQLLQAFMDCPDYRIKRQLMMGLNDLALDKMGGPVKKGEGDKIAFDPRLACKQVIQQLETSISATDAQAHKREFQRECVEYLRKNLTVQALQQQQLYPALDGIAEAHNTPVHIKHAIWDLIGQSRDRVEPVFNGVKADAVNSSPESRVELLKDALKTVQPNSLGGKEDYSGKLGIKTENASEMESRAPNAVFMIAAAVKGTVMEKGDPRIDALKELCKPDLQEKKKDERVRLAAAYALVNYCNDFETRKEALATVADVAVNGYRPGSRADAQALLSRMKGDLLLGVEEKLKTVAVDKVDSTGTAYPQKDVDMKEAARLGLLGKALATEGKTAEAEVNLRAAFNLYLGRAKETPITKEEAGWEKFSEQFDKYKSDRRLPEILNSIQTLSEVQTKLGGFDGNLGARASSLRADALGSDHVDVVNNRIKYAETLLNNVLTGKVEKGRYIGNDLDDARKHFVGAWNSMFEMRPPAPIMQRLSCLDNAARCSLLMAERCKTDGKEMEPESLAYAKKHLNIAETDYLASLKFKGNAKSSISDLAEANANLGKVYEAKARIIPDAAKEYLPKAAASYETALNLARQEGATKPLILAEQLRLSAAFQKAHGDKAKGDAFEKEAQTILTTTLGKGSLQGKSESQVLETLAKFTKELGGDHPTVGKLQADVASFYLGQGKLNLAENHADEALRVIKASNGSDEDAARAINIRHQAIFREKKADRNADCVETLTWLRDIQLRQSNGRGGEAYDSTKRDLAFALRFRAERSAKAGDYGATERDAALLLKNAGLDANSKLPADMKQHLESIRNTVIGKANALAKEGKYNEAGAPYVTALSLELRINDGVLPEKVKTNYQNLARNYEGYISGQIKEFSNTGKIADMSAAIQSWTQFHKKINDGKLSDEMLSKLNTIDSLINKKIVSDFIPDWSSYDPEKFKQAEPAIASVMASKHARLDAISERVAAGDKTLEVNLIVESQAVVNVNRSLVDHYLKEKQYDKAKTLTEKTYASIQKAEADLELQNDVIGQMAKIEASSGRKESAIVLLERQATKIMLGTQDPGKVSDSIKQLVSQAIDLEFHGDRPGLGKESAARLVNAVRANVMTLSADKQKDAMALLNPAIYEAIAESSERLQKHQTEKMGGKSTDADKARLLESLQGIKVMEEQSRNDAIKSLREKIDTWSNDPAKSTGDASGADVPSEYSKLLEIYSKSNNIPEMQSFAKMQIDKLIEKGSASQVAAMMETTIRQLMQQPQVVQVNATNVLMKDVLASLAKLPEGKRAEMLAQVGPRVTSSLQMALEYSGISMDNTQLSDTQKQALKADVENLQKTKQEWLSLSVEPLKREIQKFESSPQRGKVCEQVQSLVDIYLQQGKKVEAVEVAKQHVSALIEKGDAVDAAEAINNIYSSSYLASSSFGQDFLLGARDVVDRAMTGKTEEQKQAISAKIQPVIAGKLLLESQNAANVGNDEARSKVLKSEAVKLFTAALVPLKGHFDASLKGGKIDDARAAYADYSQACIALGKADELKTATISLVSELTTKTDLQKSLSAVRQMFDGAQADDERRLIATPAALEALKMIEAASAKLQKVEERADFYRRVAYEYEAVARYSRDSVLVTEMNAKSKALLKQSDELSKTLVPK